MLPTNLKLFDTFIIAATSTSVTLSGVGFGLINTLKSFEVAYGLTISNNVINGYFMGRFNDHKEQYERAQRTIIFSLTFV